MVGVQIRYWIMNTCLDLILERIHFHRFDPNYEELLQWLLGQYHVNPISLEATIGNVRFFCEFL